VWLSVWSEVQFFAYDPSDAISWFIKIQIGLTFLVPAYPGCPGKETVIQASACLIIITIIIQY